MATPFALSSGSAASAIKILMLEMTGLAPGAEYVDHADMAGAQVGVGQAAGAPSRPGRSSGGADWPIRTDGMLARIAGATAAGRAATRAP